VTRYRPATPGIIEQTAILYHVELPEVRGRAGEQADVVITSHPWLVVLNQECDLQFDRLARTNTPLRVGGAPVKKDKILHSVLLCPGFPEEHVLAGTYIKDATAWSKGESKTLLRNQVERYHSLPAEDPLPEALVLDFKLIVATSPDYLQTWVEQNPDCAVAVLNPPFRDRLTQRFVNYFARIAEPEGD